MRHAPERALPERPHLPGQGAPPILELEPEPLCQSAWRSHRDLAYGIDLYNAGFFWEAHEAWEGSWQLTGEGPERELLRGLIQRAAAEVQRALGKNDGAARLRERAAGHLAAAAVRPIFSGVEVGAVDFPIRWHRRSREMPGVATELAVQPLECVYEIAPGCVVQRTPTFRDYYGGRAVYADTGERAVSADDPVTAETLASWRRRATELLSRDGPGFLNLVWEREEPGPADVGELEAGDELQELVVLWADRVEPAPLPDGIEARRIEGDRDWEAVIEWAAALDVRSWGDGARAFSVWRHRAFRRTAETLGGGFFGAFAGAELVGCLGLIDCGRYLRYQSVQTSEAFRRRGIASYLVGAAHEAVSGGRPRRAVIVAEAGSAAERIYRRLGFLQVATQFALRWSYGIEESSGRRTTSALNS